MPKICPECKDPYERKETATKIEVPKDAIACYHDIEYEGGTRAGVWYIHE